MPHWKLLLHFQHDRHPWRPHIGVFTFLTPTLLSGIKINGITESLDVFMYQGYKALA